MSVRVYYPAPLPNGATVESYDAEAFRVTEAAALLLVRTDPTSKQAVATFAFAPGQWTMAVLEQDD